MEDLVEILHNYLFCAAGSLFLLQGIILLVRGKNDIAKQTMAILELVWSVSYFAVVALLHTTFTEDEYVLFREKYVLIGGYFMSFMAIYLMQILIPGWLNLKRFFLVELPFIGLTVAFYGGVYLLKEPIANLTSYEQLFDSIGQFNVWSRFVIMLLEIIYIALLLRWLNGFKQKYIQWEKENFSDLEDFDISWISTYHFIIIGITVFYMGVFFIGGRLPILFHCLFVIFSFSYMFYKALFHQSPYPAGFFASLDEQKQKEKSDEIFVISQPVKVGSHQGVRTASGQHTVSRQNAAAEQHTNAAAEMPTNAAVETPTITSTNTTASLGKNTPIGDNTAIGPNLVSTTNPAQDADSEEEDTTFSMNFQEHVELVKQWLETEKPYLHNDFKLTDVSRVLPLNRSYLSRLFNEGFGGTFSEVVRDYRVMYAKELMQKYPAISVREVSMRSGFKSQSTFFRAFRTIVGVTPRQFVEQ